MSDLSSGASLDDLRGLRARADEDFLHPATDREPGRHQVDVAELGVRVSVTRARYPNRPDGLDQYAITLSRTRLDRPSDEQEARTVLAMTFGELAGGAIERTARGSLVRLFRVPAEVRVGSNQTHEAAGAE